MALTNSSLGGGGSGAKRERVNVTSPEWPWHLPRATVIIHMSRCHPPVSLRSSCGVRAAQSGHLVGLSSCENEDRGVTPRIPPFPTGLQYRGRRGRRPPGRSSSSVAWASSTGIPGIAGRPPPCRARCSSGTGEAPGGCGSVYTRTASGRRRSSRIRRPRRSQGTGRGQRGALGMGWTWGGEAEGEEEV